jgi:general secretion pathway protein M
LSAATLPTGPRGRLLAAGLLLTMVIAAYALAIAPLLEFYSARTESVATRRALAAKLDAIAGELPALRQRVDELRAAADSSRLTLEGANDAIASAGLQGNMGELASAAGVTVGSTENLAAERTGGYRRLGVRLMLTGPYAGIVKLLGNIETATPPLIVDNLQMHGPQRRPGSTATPPLDASFEVYGFRADGAGSTVQR